MVIIRNYRLDNVQQVVTTNQGGTLDPRFIIMHYTAGPSLEGTLGRFTHDTTKNRVSAHLVIGPDGKVVQVVPFNRVAWHAGVSSWKPQKGGTIKGLNPFSVGIELVNAGPLTSAKDGAFYTWWGAQIPLSDVVEVDPKDPASFGKKYWHRFPGEQITSALEIVRCLIATYPQIEDILGHSDVAPGRKTDPGPVFPMMSFKAALFGRV